MIGLVTLYNPKINATAKNILTYLSELDYLIIWDNSQAYLPNKVQLHNLLSEYDSRLIWCGDGTNRYIAAGINFAHHYAQEHHIDTILIMDQDSSWTNFKDFREQAQTLYQSHTNYGAICPLVPSVYKLDTSCAIQPIRLFINSGTVIRTEVLTQINGADERFPLDALDNDLSIRIQQAGYQTICLTDYCLSHELGHPMRSKILHIYSTNYNAERTYSILRSYTLFLRLHHKWLNFKECKTILKEYYFWKPVRILLMEPDKWNRTKAYIRGIFDGLKIAKQ